MSSCLVACNSYNSFNLSVQQYRSPRTGTFGAVLKCRILGGYTARSRTDLAYPPRVRAGPESPGKYLNFSIAFSRTRKCWKTLGICKFKWLSLFKRHWQPDGKIQRPKKIPVLEKKILRPGKVQEICFWKTVLTRRTYAEKKIWTKFFSASINSNLSGWFSVTIIEGLMDMFDPWRTLRYLVTYSKRLFKTPKSYNNNNNCDLPAHIFTILVTHK